MRPSLPIVLLLALIAGPGCVTLGNMTTASTLAEGDNQVVLEPNFWMADGGGLPTLSLSVRHGVTDSFELGGRLGAGGFELLSKVLLTDPQSPMAVSLAPTAGGFYIGGTDGDTSAGAGFLTLNLPLLFGFKSGAGEFVVGPKVHDVIVFAGASSGGSTDSAGVNVFSAGGSVGYAFKMGGLTIMPELTVLLPLYASAGATGVDGDSAFIGGEGTLMQFSLAMMFGN